MLSLSWYIISIISLSPKKPAFNDSIIPLFISISDKESKNSVQINIFSGMKNVPIWFLPNSLLNPVFPPCAASTIPRNVEGTNDKFAPLLKVLVAKPTRSLNTPPPIPIIFELLSSDSENIISQIF